MNNNHHIPGLVEDSTPDSRQRPSGGTSVQPPASTAFHETSLEESGLYGADCLSFDPDAFSSPAAKAEAAMSPARKALQEARLSKNWKDPLAYYSGPAKILFDRMEVENYLKGSLEARCSDKEELKRHEAFIATLHSKGARRKLAVIPDDWRQKLDQLEKEQPNFNEVCSYLRGQFAFAQSSGGVLKITPILLAGSPGVGKSHFADKVAKLLGTPFTCLRMENAQSNSALAGSDTFWSNSKHGMVLEALCYGECANPVFFLDEIDKVAGQGERYDPLSALYSLLEQETAQSYSDLSYPFLKIDASSITWIAACNDVDALSAPIKSRMRIFEIPPLTPEQSVSVVKNIISRIRSETPFTVTPPRFSACALEALSQQAPRRIKQSVQDAIGQALYAGRALITANDLAKDPARRRGPGFL